MTRSRRILFAATALAVTTVVCLLAVELVLQLADYPPAGFSPWIRSAQTGFRYAPDLATRMTREEYDVAFATNSEGLRDDELRAGGGPRVLLLGDSFTSGYGVPRGEIFADLLEKELGVEVVNAGVGGYELIHQVHYLRKEGARLAPGLVVYALYLGNDLAQNDEWEALPDNGLRSRKKEFPLRHGREIKLLALVKGFLYGVKARNADRAGEWRPFPGYMALCERDLGAQAKAEYAESRALLEELRDEVRAIGAGFVVAMFSYRQVIEPDSLQRIRAETPDFDARYDMDRPAHEVAKMLRDLGVEFVNVNDALRRSYSESGKSLFFAIDGHLNAGGHRVVADALYPVLRDALARRAPP